MGGLVVVFVVFMPVLRALQGPGTFGRVSAPVSKAVLARAGISIFPRSS